VSAAADRYTRGVGTMSRVAGVDVASGRWVVVLLKEGAFEAAVVGPRLEELLEGLDEVTVVGVDIPIGLPSGEDEDWPRAADREARRGLRGRASSVFATPPRPVLECTAYDGANTLHRHLTGKGLSRQAWALGARILEVDALAAGDDRVVEVHPEVSFAALADGGRPGRGLPHGKKSWNGQHVRRGLLAAAGIELPDELTGDVGRVPPDDLLDAAAAAWSAARFAAGNGGSLGEPVPDGRPNRHAGRIWY